jgi:GNAT superfamily N-acetyltransferase
MSVPSVLEVETAALTAWPGLYTAYDGHWVWRAARGYSNRANSIQCLDPNDGANAPERIARFTELFTRHGLHPVFKVSPLTAPAVLDEVAVLNWRTYEASKVMRMSMRLRAWEPQHHTVLFDPLDPQWHAVQAEMSGYAPYAAESVRLIIERIACDRRGILAYDQDGVPVAAALACVANGIAIFGNVVARSSHRRQGFGHAVMAAALNWTRDAGAVAAGIQFAAANTPAVALYGSLGFADPYDYTYYKPQGLS